MSSWSSASHLRLNASKTKAMLLSTSQMARVHSLDSGRPVVSISDKSLDFVSVYKILGVNISEHLKLDEHVKARLRKLSYCVTVFNPLPEYLSNRLQRTQFAAASFVLGRYVNSKSDILNLGWLPSHKLRDYSLLRNTFRAMYSSNWPSYLESSAATRLVTPLLANTFQNSTATY
ncbi:uncharacterized protein LOC125561363 [Nematostella vectensis]|uniref:uncharacterized protein LOC125561363 n=1 Tax=Nematostella vectensis TaxID=45351 RepID=UPI0020773F6F|nr:uncharacterized protein LOC125561363 [Nematostella vectensis]